MSRFVRFWLRYHRLILLFSILITVPAAVFSAKLYGNLKPDLEELLPRKSRAILDLDEIRSRLKSVQKLSILIFSKDAEAAKKFQLDLAARLEALPPTEVSGIEYRIDRELKFFEKRKALFLEMKDLTAIRDHIRDRIQYEKQLYNPIHIFSGQEVPEPKFDFRAIEKKYQGKASPYMHFPEGFYALPDGTKRLIFAYLPAEKSGMTGVHEFKDQVEKIVQELNPKNYAPDLELHYAGAVQDIIEEHTALVDDIEHSAFIVFTIVLVALVIFFRSILATAALLGSLFMARFWSFGVSWFTVGSLNANSAFMGSIVLGSGITFGVILLARYLEERRRRRSPVRAATIAITHTARATWTAALCAGFAYGALFVTEFEGFKQYGIIGLTGMIVCWISSIVVLPGLLLEIERWKRIVPAHAVHKRKHLFLQPLTHFIRDYPVWIVILGGVFTLFCIDHVVDFNLDRVLEKNLANLRNRVSMQKGSGHFAKTVDQILQAPNSPVVALAHSYAHAREISSRLKHLKESEGDSSLILDVADIHQFMPPDQTEKIKVLQQIRRLLPPQILNRLSKEDRAKALELLDTSQLEPVTMATLPPLVRDKFTEKDGSIGRLVLVDPRQDSELWSGDQLNHFVGSVRRVSDSVEGRKVPVAGQITVTSDMIASIIRDGPRATLFAWLAVVILVLLFFRNLRASFLILVSLFIGVLWMLGIILWFDIKINFLNFIAFPITFGIGVDYAVNLFHRYLSDPKRDILHVVRETGGAICLCSFTTIVGYSSLLIAQNQAFVSFGTIAVLGEVTTLLSALVLIPACLIARKWDSAKRKSH